MNNTSTITISFYELIQQYKIEIPIIQRDYAQGRIENNNILTTFLNSIKENLDEGKTLNLDFVYGSINGEVSQYTEKGKGTSTSNLAFHPLDGQQRLTTLFLLHWYALQYANLTEYEKQTAQKILINFTYETRLSSRRFCELLTASTLNIIVEENEKKKKLSETIINQHWFSFLWQQDPTISTMLNALDTIDTIFDASPSLWYQLTNEENITFNLLILENFGLSDDLYMKMNARGKSLTSFENFKAEYEAKIDKENWEDNLKESSEKFKFKIDTSWNNFLWLNFIKKWNETAKNSNKAAFVTDYMHMRFITALVMSSLAIKGLDKNYTSEIRDNSLQVLNSAKGEEQLIYYLDYTDENTFQCIVNSYEAYEKIYNYNKNISNELHLDFPLWREKPQTFLDYIIFNENTSYAHKILFFAQTQYLLHNNFEKTFYDDWMRIIRNIIAPNKVRSNGTRIEPINSVEDYISMIILIKELSEYSKDIYSFLADETKISTLKSSARIEQLKHEKVKAKIIKHETWGSEIKRKEIIHSLEDNILLRANLDFPLYCAQDNSADELLDFDLLEKLCAVINRHFSTQLEDTRSDEFNYLRRVLLTLKQTISNEEESSVVVYDIYTYWESWWHAPSKGAYKYRLFLNLNEVEHCIKNAYYYPHFFEFIKEILKIEEKFPKLSEERLEVYKKIIMPFKQPKEMPLWQYQIIKCDDIISFWEGCWTPYYFAVGFRKTDHGDEITYLLHNSKPNEIKANKRLPVTNPK